MQKVMKKMKGGKLANMMRGLGGMQGQTASGMSPFSGGKPPRF
jgi:signal recognition particle subunit SRP54